MKFNFRKISAIAASVLMTGMTLGVAAAAAYPAPFISGGAANVAIVYGTGTGVSSLDLVQAGNIQSNLQSKMGTSVTTPGSVEGNAKSLNSGSNLLYLLDDLAENVATITKSDLPTILADGKFVDNDGTTYEYDQTITVGTSATNRFSFGNSDNEFDDPALMLELSTGTSTPMYTWTVNFDAATPLNATDSEGEEISLLGKSYTIGTATDGDTLVLLGGADSQTINYGETVTMEVEGVSHEVTLVGLSDAATSVASITVDGQSKTFTEGQTKTFVLDTGEVDVYAKSVFRTGDGTGHVEVEIGANKITLESASAVKVGSDNTEIEGTLVTFTGTANNVVGSLTKIIFAVAAPDSDVNHVLIGESFTDPIFGTLKLEFNSVTDGPVFEAEKDSGRTSLKLGSGGNRELEVTFTDSAGTTKTNPFTYQNQMRDDSGNPFITVEGSNLTDDDYFILNSGDYQHLMQVTKLTMASITTADFEAKDVFTGAECIITDKDFTLGQNCTVNSQTYVVINNTGGADAGVRILSADAYAGTHRDLFPNIELVAGESFPRLAFVNQTNAINDGSGDTISPTTGVVTAGRTYNLPTGTVQFRRANISASAWTEYGVTPTDGTTTWTNISGANSTGINWTSIQVGEGWYTFATTNTYTAIAGPATLAINNVTVDYGFDTYAAASYPTSPMLMFVENKDKSDADARNVVLFNTTDDATYSELADVLFSGTSGSQYDTEGWDNTDLTGYLTNYGTYVLRDYTNTDIHIASLTYGKSQMYANVYFAELSATITPGAGGGAGQLGDVLVTDDEVSNVATKNLIIVGGSCINSAAAALVGGVKCGAAWTTATGVGTGQFLIKSYADADNGALTNKLALLVAGYDAADTANAATYLRTKAVDTSTGGIGTTSTATLTAFA